ncbi:hypothetical protein RND81_02G205000 [Saponaria officinalis]|uniref:Uncharacterized protein n=1 Tax=Saponaria officinalis TaxID=3572 RepID=A0AAW1MNE3_SAPOF
MVLKKSCIFALILWFLITLFFISRNHFHTTHIQHLNSVNRKIIIPSKKLFDFTPFNVPHNDHRHQSHSPPYNEDEIDHRYGVQKRLVPTGPNPLHH